MVIVLKLFLLNSISNIFLGGNFYDYLLSILDFEWMDNLLCVDFHVFHYTTQATVLRLQESLYFILLELNYLEKKFEYDVRLPGSVVDHHGLAPREIFFCLIVPCKN